MGICLHRAPSDGATLLRNELPVSGKGSRNMNPGSRGISLESLPWESKHVPVAQRPYEMWAGRLQQLQRHTQHPLGAQAVSCCHCLQQQGLGEHLWAKRSKKKQHRGKWNCFVPQMSSLTSSHCKPALLQLLRSFPSLSARNP